MEEIGKGGKSDQVSGRKRESREGERREEERETDSREVGIGRRQW